MSSSSDALGGRLPLIERSALSESQQQLYDRMTESFVPWAERAGFSNRTGDGRFIGPFNPALRSPVVCGAFLDLQAAEEENTSLAPRVRQVVILAVGAVWGAAYELYAHAAAARSAGLPDQVVQALSAGEMPGELSAAEQAAWRFAHQLTAQRQVEQPVYDQAHAVFGDRGLTDMLILRCLPDRLRHPQRLRDPRTGTRPGRLTALSFRRGPRRRGGLGAGRSPGWRCAAAAT